uniref:Uncharacterized protein n=1 Tax=Lepeophtheirus salmonis TaxID=72036 RepID=A0A0K2VBR2_LEPSM
MDINPKNLESSDEEEDERKDPEDGTKTKQEGKKKKNKKKKDYFQRSPFLVGLAVGGTSIIAAPFILTAAGFGAAGVASGSIAAGVQSAVYGGATSGIFSILQSAGAVGISAASTAIIGTSTGTVAAVVTQKINNAKSKS